MAKYRITTPTPGYTGVSVGVNFTKGVAEIEAPILPPLPVGAELDRDERREREAIAQDENLRRVAYFRSQGYGVEEIEPDEPEPAEEPDDEPKAPARSASKADWAAYAVSQGVDADEADKQTRDQLAERFLDQKEG
ncbi:hypothetical protein [Streptomyces scabiei]|uniref:hypothetical protein n=1 Tax=Streptomyces scabiei TaxID=1930 RepID=UPI0033E3D08B